MCLVKYWINKLKFNLWPFYINPLKSVFFCFQRIWFLVFAKMGCRFSMKIWWKSSHVHFFQGFNILSISNTTALQNSILGAHNLPTSKIGNLTAIVVWFKNKFQVSFTPSPYFAEISPINVRNHSILALQWEVVIYLVIKYLKSLSLHHLQISLHFLLVIMLLSLL